MTYIPTGITSIVSTIPSSVLVGASIIGLTPVSVTFPINQNVSGSVLALPGNTPNTVPWYIRDVFFSRSDTFTATGNGTTVDVATDPLESFSVQVKCTGATATAWDVRLEGSLNGTDFTQILAHTNVDGDGLTKFSGTADSPCLYFRSRVAGLTLGAATNIVVTILGTT